jgi:hypothetical protein
VLVAVDRYQGRDDGCTAELRVVPLRVTLDRRLGGRRVVDAMSGPAGSRSTNAG